MSEKEDSGILRVAEFTPIDQAVHGRRKVFRTGTVVAVMLGLVALAVMLYLITARAVIFHVNPEGADVEIAGLDFNLGKNYLLLPGERVVTVSAEGYVTAEKKLVIDGDETREVTIELEPLPGNLRVTSDLEGVDVLVDGKPAGKVPGLVENLKRGDHRIEFSKYRYFPLEKDLKIEGLGRTQDLDIQLEPAWGWMELTSEPSGAGIFVDNKRVGTTPATIEILETGSNVSLSAEGYKTWEERLTVAAGTTEKFTPVKLEVAEGTLAIASNPTGASVTIDGKYAGVTPLETSVSPLKTHKLELYLEGYKKISRTAEVESDKTATLTLVLQPNIGNIKLNVTPSDALVLVDGREVGNGSLDLALPARQHRLEIRKAGYQSHVSRITPKPGQRQSLTIALLTRQQAYWAKRPPVITSPVGTTLKLFRPSGAFTLGAPRREPGRRANEIERRVALKRPFYIGEKEITNGQFREWRATHSSTSFKGHPLDLNEQPVVMVSWQDAASFCNWLSEKAGLPDFYQVSGGKVTGFNWDSTGYRLPTEAEWAWVAKIAANGKTLMFPWGNELYPPTSVVENYADPTAASLVNFTLSDYSDGYTVSAPVGRFAPNHNGLYDMGGNVAEWVNDYYDVQGHSGEPIVDPRGPESGNRYVVRGSSWAEGSRASLRWSARRVGVEGELDIGFRIARYVDDLEDSQ